MLNRELDCVLNYCSLSGKYLRNMEYSRLILTEKFISRVGRPLLHSDKRIFWCQLIRIISNYSCYNFVIIRFDINNRISTHGSSEISHGIMQTGGLAFYSTD